MFEAQEDHFGSPGGTLLVIFDITSTLGSIFVTLCPPFGTFLVLISIHFRPFSLHLHPFRLLFALRGRFWMSLGATIVLMLDPRLSFWQSRLRFFGSG